MSGRQGVLDIWAVQYAPVWNQQKQNYQRIESMLLPLVDKKSPCDLIVLPEMFATGFSLDFESSEKDKGDTVIWMLKLAERISAVVVGSVKVEKDNRLVNRLYWVTPDRDVRHYDKVHLFGGENKNFVAGKERVITSLNGFKIFLQTCYDLRFPVFCRNNQSEYDLLINVASWPKPRIAHWNALVKARAIENVCYCVAVNRVGSDGNHWHYVGESQMVSPSGEIIAHAPLEREQVITARIEQSELDGYRDRFRFLQDADAFSLIEIGRKS